MLFRYNQIWKLVKYYAVLWISIEISIAKVRYQYFGLLAFLIEYTVEGMLFVDRRVRIMRPRGGQRNRASESVLAGELW